ncbi:MAG: DUF3379 family protein [Pseudomonadota bacterium]
MDCKTFRERFDASPHEDFEGRDEHLVGCSDCTEYTETALAFEAKLKAALAVDVPDFPVYTDSDDAFEAKLQAALAVDAPDFPVYTDAEDAFEAKLKTALAVAVPDFPVHTDANAADPFEATLQAALAVDVPDFPVYTDAELAFEAKLKSALEVNVPDIPMPALETATDEKVVSLDAARTRTRTAAPLRPKPMAWIALAASVMLAAVVGFQFAFETDSAVYDRPELVAEVLGHMVHERQEMSVKGRPASFSTVAKVTSDAGSKLDDDIGLISYARSCVINGESIPHLVLQGKNGPVTLLIMPNEPVKRVIPFEDADFHGAIVPVGETGSVAIIGRRGEPLDEIRDTIADKIRLSI